MSADRASADKASAGTASAGKALFLPTLFLPTLFLPTLFLPTVFAEEPLTLADCYRLALKRSETIAIHQELIAETEARFTQALSGILPRVSFSSSDKRQDGTGSSVFTLRKVPDRRFIMSQPLFSGFKEFAAMAGTRAERRQREEERRRAEQLLLVDVSDAFHLLLEQQDDLAALEMSGGILRDRIEELQQREQIGRTRPSEVVSAQARLLQLEAEQSQVRAQALVARQLLEFLTGLDRLHAVTDTGPALPTLPLEREILAKALGRPDVLAAQQATIVAQKEVEVQRADLWPSVSVDSNYWLERAGASKDVSWDVALTVDVPIFEGGQTRGAIREAASQARQTELKLTETQRRAVLELRDTYALLQAAIVRTAALEKAYDAADENYRLQAEDYRRSQVSNLEVLQALQTLQDARRDALNARYEAKRRTWQLKASLGERP